MRSSKLFQQTALRTALGEQKKLGKKIVFTNGCFDILHVGHLRYLRSARSLGDSLVVALNTDASTKRLKGPSRPVNNERDRAEILSGLECVDYIVFFSEDTPEKLIHSLKPDFLVKGGDWKKKDIVGSEFVESYGGKVLSLPFVKGFSTTGLLKKIQSL